MPKLLTRLAVFCAIALLSGACDPRFVHDSDLRPSDVQRLAGVWEGRGSLSFGGSNSCPRIYLLTLRVGEGKVSGEMIDQARTATTPASFTTFLEYDGSLHAFVRTDGRDMNILGSFGREAFSGTARAPDCYYVVRLKRRDAAS